jgi:acyl-[acyl-carrier-protein]-phospholipid O-acyltransferase/long-chain-fatty-acid--[acyl-carrier-protein] ligase
MVSARSSGATSRELSLGLWAVLGCQFMGAFNDHFFKMIVSLVAIEAGSGGAGGSAYLSLSGVIYVLPFLLFSGFAGYLADRFDKRTVMIATKGFEVVLGALALVGLVLGSIELMLAVLFLFATQSAFFSPPKYGILPDIVPAGALPRANGLVEFSRYVAIIGGTALAGVFSSLWGRDSLGLGLFILIVALLGWSASFGIPTTGRPGPVPGKRGGPALGTWEGIKFVATQPKLRVLVCMTTALDFAMTLISLTVLLLAKQTMSLSDLRSGLFIALAGIGVAVGSILAGHLSRGRAELGFLPFGAAGASAALILLSNSTSSFPLAATALTAMGAFTGFLVVPLYTALQKTAPRGELGRVIGGNNFFNMFGVLVGSGLLWVLHDVLELAPRTILAVLALATLTMTTTALGRSPRLRARVSLLAAAALECLHQILLISLAWMRHLPALLWSRLGARRS